MKGSRWSWMDLCWVLAPHRLRCVRALSSPGIYCQHSYQGLVFYLFPCMQDAPVHPLSLAVYFPHIDQAHHPYLSQNLGCLLHPGPPAIYIYICLAYPPGLSLHSPRGIHDADVYLAICPHISSRLIGFISALYSEVVGVFG